MHRLMPLMLLTLWLSPSQAELSPESAAKNQPVAPFRIAGRSEERRVG